MERGLAVVKGGLLGGFLGGLIGIAAVTFVGTACLAAGVGSAHLAVGPIPFMTAYTGNTSGFYSEWGVWLVGVAGGVFGAIRVLQGRPLHV